MCPHGSLRLRFTDHPDLTRSCESLSLRPIPEITPHLTQAILDASPIEFPIYSPLRVRWIRHAVERFKFSLEAQSISVQILDSPNQEASSPLIPDLLYDSIPVVPKTFTEFRKWVEKTLPDPPLPIPPVFPIPGTSSNETGFVTFDHDPKSAVPFDPTESAALARIEEYFFESDGLRNYKKTRNGLIGANYSSKFSVFLALGLISARTLWAKVREHEAHFGISEGSEWMRFELLWREYFKHQHLHSGEKFFSKEGLQNRSQNPVRDHELFLRWTRAETGEPFVDANLRELNATGFMSNRGRQNVASYFVHTLRLPWWWGARYFEYSLLDYDPTQNWGNWAYQAGVGADPRSFGGAPRIFDVRKQARDYDLDGGYQRLWGIKP